MFAQKAAITYSITRTQYTQQNNSHSEQRKNIKDRYYVSNVFSFVFLYLRQRWVPQQLHFRRKLPFVVDKQTVHPLLRPTTLAKKLFDCTTYLIVLLSYINTISSIERFEGRLSPPILVLLSGLCPSNPGRYACSV